MSSGFTCGASMTSVWTVCFFCDSCVEGDDVDEDRAVEFSEMSLILFPFHESVYVFASLSLCTFHSKSHGHRKIMSNIHMDQITPNFVLKIANLEWYQISMSNRNDMTIRPCDLVGLRKLLSWQIKFVNNLLGDKIYCTFIVNNHISQLAFDSYPCVKFLSQSPFFFLFICIKKSATDKSGIFFSSKKSLHNMGSWSLRLSFFRLTLSHVRSPKHMLNTESF